MMLLILLKKNWGLKFNDHAKEGFESGKAAQKVQDLQRNSRFDQKVQVEYLQKMF